MPSLPTSLALTTIADGSPIIASDHRNNYAAVQTAVNALIADMTGGSTDQFLSTIGSTVVPAYPPGHEWDYKQITANANITDTAEGTATALITSNSVTYDGNPVIAEFFCYTVFTETAAAGNTLTVTLYEGASELFRLAQIAVPSVTAQMNMPVYGRVRFTPTAAAHTYKVCAFVTNTTGTPLLVASAGGSGAPAFIRFTKV